MKSLKKLLELKKSIRVLGFDDVPFEFNDLKTNIIGSFCINTKFEGMLFSEVDKDGNNSTDVLIETISKSKFYDQTNIILLDGIAFGGFNVIDINKLFDNLKIPVVSLMRKLPDLKKIEKALNNLPDCKEKINLLKKAGEIYNFHPFYFQVAGEEKDIINETLIQLTTNSNIPEALRISHLIGSSLKTGESSRRA